MVDESGWFNLATGLKTVEVNLEHGDGEEIIQTDATLAVRGDAESFMQLYCTHLRAVHNYLFARTGNRQDAEDLTALVFERAWISLKNYKPVGSFKAWLFTIVQRALADHYRRSKPHSITLDSLTEQRCHPVFCVMGLWSKKEL